MTGQTHAAALAVDHLDHRALLGEVVERVGVDLADRDGVLGDGGRGRAVAAPATSNQPVRPTSSTGLVSGAELAGVERQDLVDAVHRRRQRRQPWCSTTWSMHAVRASTSAGSMAGNMPMRSWLRPSLR